MSIEDPVFRRTPIFSPQNVTATLNNGSIQNFGVTNQPTPVFTGYTDTTPTRFSFVDSIERERMPDFVGVLRLDRDWGSAQLSAASHELNIGNVANGAGTGSNLSIPHARSTYGWAVQGGLKVNMPFIAPGDVLYLQGAYADGAQNYTGFSYFPGSYTQSTTTFQGQKFTEYFADATVNPFTGQLQTSQSFTVAAAYLHYWIPELRSAFFASYGEQSFSSAARFQQGLIYGLVSGTAGTAAFGSNAVGVPGTRFYSLSQALRDSYQIAIGGNLIWSPVKDLDIGVEGFYTEVGLQRGRVIDVDKSPTAYANIAGINAGTFAVRTATQDSGTQIRFRVQRDF